jgi:hypothetical protein
MRSNVMKWGILEGIGELNLGPWGWAAAAVGVVALAPAARKGVWAAAVKATALGIAAKERLQEATAGAREGWSALVEEARAERSAAQEPAAG